MKNHILLDKAYKYQEKTESPIMGNCFYDIQKGYWIIEETKEILMLSEDRIKPQTKKADRETGEDLKGE